MIERDTHGARRIEQRPLFLCKQPFAHRRYDPAVYGHRMRYYRENGAYVRGPFGLRGTSSFAEHPFAARPVRKNSRVRPVCTAYSFSTEHSCREPRTRRLRITTYGAVGIARISRAGHSEVLSWVVFRNRLFFADGGIYNASTRETRLRIEPMTNNG